MKKALLMITAAAVVFFSISCAVDPVVITHRVTVKNGDTEYRTKDVADGDIYVLPVKPDSTLEFKGWKAEESTTLL